MRVTGSDNVPNMSQRALMQCLSLDFWKLSDRLPVRVGEMMLNRLLYNRWIESRGEKHRREIRLTVAGAKAMRTRI
jgi:hypothetical protein